MERADKKKVSALISLIRHKTYKLLRDLVSPEKPQGKTFKFLTDLLKQQLAPRRIIVSERFHFHRCDQEENQSISDFIAKLCEKASTCNFGPFLNEALRDQFITGVRSCTIQTKLLSADIDLSTAISTALANESAHKEAQKIGPEISQSLHEVHVADSQPVHQLQRRHLKGSHPKSPDKPCYRYGRDHEQNTCPFKSATCHACKKRGHISTVCKSKWRQSPQPAERPVYFVNPEDGDGSESSVYGFYKLHSIQESIHQLSRPRGKPIKIPVRIDGLALDMELDTGAGLSVISEETYNLLNQHGPALLHPAQVGLRTHTGERVSVKGIVQAEVQYKDQKTHVPLIVTKEKGPNLIGRNVVCIQV